MIYQKPFYCSVILSEGPRLYAVIYFITLFCCFCLFSDLWVITNHTLGGLNVSIEIHRQQEIMIIDYIMYLVGFLTAIKGEKI